MPNKVYRMFVLVMVLGVLASILGGSILPLLVTAAACWGAYHVARGLYG